MNKPVQCTPTSNMLSSVLENTANVLTLASNMNPTSHQENNKFGLISVQHNRN